jgi:peptidoglycan/LPS O-acetylase OafA/YrhL
MSFKRNKIDGLQSLRAVAAIFVMVFHGTQMIEKQLGYSFLNNFFMAGFSGVDIFFVLSGFIILYTSYKANYSIAGFLKKRFIRIYPIYWVVSFLLVLAFLFAPDPGQSYKTNLSFILSSFSLFPQEKYIVGIAWTLSYEVIFYLVFAFTYLRNPKLLLYTFIVWISIILITDMLHLKTGVYAVDALLNPIIINFALGCLVAHLYIRYAQFVQWRQVLATGLFLFALSWVVYYIIVKDDPVAFTAPISRVYLFGLPSAFIIFGIAYSNSFNNKVMVYLGDASYSLYLIHGTVLSMILKLVVKFRVDSLLANMGGALVIFGATILVGCLFYRFVEKPLIGIARWYLEESKLAVYLAKHYRSSISHRA